MREKQEFSMQNLVEHYNQKVRYYKENTLEEWHLKKELTLVNKLLNKILKRRHCTQGLDIACHDGRYSFLMQGKGLKVIGIDTSSKSLAFAKQRGRKKVKFMQMNATKLKFDIKFDVIILMELLHHLPDKVASDVLQRAIAHLKPGGYLILDVKNKYNPVINWVYKQNSSKELLLKPRSVRFFQKIIKTAGAKIVHKTGLLTRFWQIEPFIIMVVQNK